MALKNLEQTLLVLTVFFLPTQLGKHFWPQFSHIYSLPIDYLSPTLFFWDILVVLLLLSSFAQRKYINRLALNLWLFFILTQSLSLIFTTNLGAGLVRLEQYLIAGLFGVYIASWDFNKIKSLIFYPLGFSVIFQSLLGISQFFASKTIGFWILGERSFNISTPGIAKFDFYNQQFLRPYATFPHPNVLSAFLLIGGYLGLILKEGKKLLKIQLILSLVTIFITFSRVSILATILTGLFVLKNKWRLLAIMVLLALSPILIVRFGSVLNYDSLSFLRREQLGLAAFTSFLTSPLFGVGLNNFIPNLADQLIAGPNRFLQPVHNIFLLSLSETGVMGLVGFCSLLTYPIYKLFKQKTKVSQMMLLIWVLIVFLGFFDHFFLTLPQGYRLLFLMWGLTLSMLRT